MNWLSSARKLTSPEIVVKPEGISPEKLLLDISSRFKLLSSEISRGSSPERRLPERKR